MEKRRTKILYNSSLLNVDNRNLRYLIIIVKLSGFRHARVGVCVLSENCDDSQSKIVSVGTKIRQFCYSIFFLLKDQFAIFSVKQAPNIIVFIGMIIILMSTLSVVLSIIFLIAFPTLP